MPTQLKCLECPRRRLFWRLRRVRSNTGLSEATTRLVVAFSFSFSFLVNCHVVEEKLLTGAVRTALTAVTKRKAPVFMLTESLLVGG